ncbi:MAG TPA: ATP-binding protein, partial [Magnetospirillaceae bacterium]|nr:ATP-binding protein [Magnetospirillaceae bacterium]
MDYSRGHGGVRPKFCLLLASVHTGASVELWRGVAEEAEARDVDLLVLPAGRLAAREECEHMRNRLAGLVTTGSVDGLLSWASSLSGERGPEDVLALHKGFGQLALVTLSQRIGNAPLVDLDAYGGMRAVLDHLRDVHGYSRIAFLRGPGPHPSAEDRFRAYRDFLAARSLRYDCALVSSPFPWDEGDRALTELLDERGLVPGQDFQAAAAASDLLAFRFLRGLQDRGYQVPADVSVTGFNDSLESRLLAPPLTTVALPFREQGRRGLALLSDLWQGTREPRDDLLPGSLVVRESCGCPSVEVSLAGATFAGGTEGREAPVSASLLSAMDADSRAKAASEEVALAAGVGEGAREAWILPLVRAFQDETEGGGRFLDILGRILDRSVHEENPEPSWQNAISILDRLAPGLRGGQESGFVRALLSRARVMIGQAEARRRDFIRWTSDEKASRLRSLGRALLTTYTVSGIADLLAEHLPGLGIRHCFLILDGPEGGAVRLALRDSRREPLPEDGLPAASAAEIPEVILPTGRYSLVLEPLFVNDEALGCLALDASVANGWVFEELRGFVSAAIKGALLFAQAAEARIRAERADRLKTRLLANVSHELRTPLALILDEARALAAEPGHGGPPADGGQLERGLARIADHARHQSRMVNDLLDLSRAEIEEIDLALGYEEPGKLARDCLQSFLAGVQPEGGVEWSADIRDPLPLVRMDSGRVRQILLNLLENARRHTELGIVRLMVRAAPPWLEMEVEDTGCGIPPDRLEEVFEPFSSDEKAGGIGLGLAISRRLAALHGGRIDAASDPGRGSRFTLRLPLPLLGTSGQAPEIRGLWVAALGPGAPHPEAAKALRAQGWDVRGPESIPWEGTGTSPGAFVLDPGTLDAASWDLLRWARRDSRMAGTPLLLYESVPPADASGIGSLPPTREFLERLDSGRFEELLTLLGRPILVVDDDPDHRERLRSFFGREFPGFAVAETARGDETLDLLTKHTPALVVLDLGLPGAAGEDVLGYMKSEERLRHVPVLVLTGRVLGEEELLKLDRHSRLVVQVKGIWTDQEFARTVRLALRDDLAPG